jgi:hypothetical protein
MRRVKREEIVDYQTYEDERAAFRQTVFVEKAKRRIHVGSYLTFLFETTLTIRYQIQEMMRIERIVREKDIQHELDTYNELLGDAGQLGCTLLIEIDDPRERDEKLSKWLDLLGHLYIELEGGQRATATWDARQVGTDRLSSVQYLKFRIGDGRPVALGADHRDLTVRCELDAAQRELLDKDARE